jgi:pyruvate/2-oxoglutarate dehydrogenase complex dihydrolipoamide dehydrogenase (E3) component
MAGDHYQNIVIGSGEAGKNIAWTLARQGQKTLVVERSVIGGACPNVACLPSKNVIFSARVASLIGRASEFGIATGPVKIDIAGVIRRKQNMVDQQRRVHTDLFQSSGADVVMGEARFTEARTMQVTLREGDMRLLHGERIFLAIGTRATMPDVPGLSDARPMTHVETLNLQRLPEHLVILGGGYIGLEFAQAMRRFGARVTVIHRGPRLLDREDTDVSDALSQLMKAEGIETVLSAELLNVAGRSGQSVQLQVRRGGETNTIEATDILVATGRTPNTDRLDAARGGVELDSRGYIRVDEKLRTTAPDVWAMGECAGSPQFTHVGYDDFRIVRDNLAGGNHTTRGRIIPYCLFTDPELVHVGIRESEANAQNIRYRIATIPMSQILRTRTTLEDRGFLKALVGDDDRILGFTAFGAEASELLAAVQTAMLGGLPYTALRDAIFAHPTVAEGLTVLFQITPQPPKAS